MTITTLAHTTTKPELADRYGLLLSVKPRFADAILDGTKTVELRRRPPRSAPETVVIYGSGDAKSVLGVATLNKIHTSTPDDIWVRFGAAAGISRDEFDAYFIDSDTATAIELTSPRRAVAALPLHQLREFGIEPPQSWRYIDRSLVDRLLDLLSPPTPPSRSHWLQSKYPAVQPSR